ncbi:MAG TPA: hypothetical protein PKC39_15555 [Ferruginibacter sp.]|nr:hypothetical protein [Ferruginibacter sp.]HMP22375.1 hypothetical protein [Ferruginibacter sp.]
MLICSFTTAAAQKPQRNDMHDSLKQTLSSITININKAEAKATTLSSNAVKIKDSIAQTLEAVPKKFINTIDKKIDAYSGRITNKTVKTLERLSRWETKIKKQLEQVSPETAKRLFANNRLTFAAMLQKVKDGESITKDWHKQYDEYRDKLTVSLKYLDEQKAYLDQKMVQPLAKTKAKMDELEKTVDNHTTLEALMKERKKELVDAAFAVLGNGKYLTKMNKEVWYYAETMKNYKQLFNDPAKAEATAKQLLDKIPAFKNFMQQNSMLASLFGQPGDMAATANLVGLQTRAGVQSLLQSRIAAAGPGAQQVVQQQMQQAQVQLNQLKDKLLKNPAFGNGGGNLPDFKPNMQKTKTFKQRLEWGTNIQFARNSNLLPATSDIALTVGYKLNDRSVIGLGASYKMGLGSISKIRFSTEGLGLRSFIDWKLKKQFFISGGYEMNYLPGLSEIQLPAVYGSAAAWQQSALLGVSKKIPVKSKWCKSTKLQLLYDFLAGQQVPPGRQWVFRVGYEL